MTGADPRATRPVQPPAAPSASPGDRSGRARSLDSPAPDRAPFCREFLEVSAAVPAPHRPCHDGGPRNRHRARSAAPTARRAALSGTGAGPVQSLRRAGRPAASPQRTTLHRAPGVTSPEPGRSAGHGWHPARSAPVLRPIASGPRAAFPSAGCAAVRPETANATRPAAGPAPGSTCPRSATAAPADAADRAAPFRMAIRLCRAAALGERGPVRTGHCGTPGTDAAAPVLLQERGSATRQPCPAPRVAPCLTADRSTAGVPDAQQDRAVMKGREGMFPGLAREPATNAALPGPGLRPDTSRRANPKFDALSPRKRMDARARNLGTLRLIPARAPHRTANADQPGTGPRGDPARRTGPVLSALAPRGPMTARAGNRGTRDLSPIATLERGTFAGQPGNGPRCDPARRSDPVFDVLPPRGRLAARAGSRGTPGAIAAGPRFAPCVTAIGRLRPLPAGRRCATRRRNKGSAGADGRAVPGRRRACMRQAGGTIPARREGRAGMDLGPGRMATARPRSEPPERCPSHQRHMRRGTPTRRGARAFRATCPVRPGVPAASRGRRTAGTPA